LLAGTEALPQADISMATHWYNRANYNPASIAKTEYLYLFSNVRQQWIGIDGAPQVFNVQASEYIHSIHSAFGLSLVSDRIGVTSALNPLLTYAYRISNDRDWSFSMGLSAGVFIRSVDGSLFEAVNSLDPSIRYNMENITKPDANVGFEFQDTHFIFSISTTHLFSVYRSDSMFLNTNHRYGSIIYKNTNPELFNYHLGLQAINRHNQTIIEGNVSIRFKHPTGLIAGPKEIFDLGLTYRSTDQLTFLFGLNISSNLRVGYAYDKSFSPVVYQNRTHEIMLEYRIPSKAASTRCQCENLGYWYH
jgi:type IX secretion system PorP/SprF family membrane protein